MIKRELDAIQRELEKLHEKLTSMANKVGDVAEDVARNAASLEEHMRRTKASEERISRLENWHLGMLTLILVQLAAILVKVVI